MIELQTESEEQGMASRNILHRSKLESFKEYLISKGWVIQDTKGLYEVLRAVNPKVMKRPLIIYDGRSKEHLSVDNRDFGIVRDYINHREDDIELVIKIPEEVYRYAKKYNGSSMLTLREEEMGVCMNAIANGTPLPKGHGDLIDRQEIAKPYLKKLRAKINEEIDFEEKWLNDVFWKDKDITLRDIEIAMNGIRHVVKGELEE